jgi:hypothetical protein
MLVIDLTVKSMTVSGRHCQSALGRNLSFKRVIDPSEPGDAVSDRQFSRSAKGRAASGPAIALWVAAAARESIAATVVLGGNPDIGAVEGAGCIRGRRGRLRVRRHSHPESKEGAQQTAGEAVVHRSQATTRSGTRIFPLVSGPSSSAITKLAAPTQVPTIIGIAKPRP